MKIVVVFGEDELSSYKRFVHVTEVIRKRNWELIDISPVASLSEVLASGSLFSTERLISVRDAKKISVKEYTWLGKHYKDYEGRLLLYFSGNIPAPIKKLLPKDTTYEEFKLKKELFSFLEVIAPGNGKVLVKQFHKIIEVDHPELVLAMLGRQVRDLAWVKSGAVGFGGPSWRIQKLSRQANKFSWEQLKKFVADVAEADVKSKIGQGELVVLLDLILIKL